MSLDDLTLRWVLVDAERQLLHAYQGQQLHRSWPISTSRFGLGEQKDSGKTPRGWHAIRAKVGDGLPKHAVLKGRRFRGHVLSQAEVGSDNATEDYILTRILWLSGEEEGINRLGNVDTMQRYIYIHGTHEPQYLGQPRSHGCIRMSCGAIMDLFDWAPVGARVYIAERTEEGLQKVNEYDSMQRNTL